MTKDRQRLKALYQRAIDRFGCINQMLKVSEELGELNQVLMKYMQAIGDGTSAEARARIRDHVSEEMADVVITMDQLAMILKNTDDVYDWRGRKQQRLLERLDALDRWDAIKAEAEAEAEATGNDS